MNRIALPLLFAASVIAVPSQAAPPSDTEKLKLLSCVPPGKMIKERDAAMAWLYTAVDLEKEGWPRLRVPVKLNGACLANVALAEMYGAPVAEGYICNESLDQFKTAMRSVGIVLEKDTTKQSRPGSWIFENALQVYRVMPIRGNHQYAFSCVLSKDALEEPAEMSTPQPAPPAR